MTRILVLAGLVCVLGVSGVVARPPENEELSKQLKDLKDEIADLKKMHRLEAAATNVELKALGERLDRIEKMLERMTPAGTTRSSFSVDPRPRPTGTIKLDNRLGVRALVTVDGVTYDVAPLSVRFLRNQPAGAFTYEVTAEGYGLGAPRRTTLAGRETWTLTIY